MMTETATKFATRTEAFAYILNNDLPPAELEAVTAAWDIDPDDALKLVEEARASAKPKPWRFSLRSKRLSRRPG
jgi:hypothetical protein